VRALGASAPTATVHVVGSGVRLRSGNLYHARLDGDWRRVTGVDRATLSLAAASDQGASQELGLTVAHRPGHTEGRLERLVLTPPEGPTWRLAEPTPFTVDDGLTTDLRLAAGAQQVRLAGHVAQRGASDARLVLEQVELTPLCRLAALP